MDADRIVSPHVLPLIDPDASIEQMVLDAGRIVEFDRPAALLGHEGGFLRSLVDESGDREALVATAKVKRRR